MHYVDKYIQKNIPKELHDYAYEVAEELWEMLLALDKKDRVKPSLRGAEKDFLEILMGSDKIFKAFNKFFDIYMKKDKRKKFFELLKKEEFGFTNEDLSYLLHSYMVFIFLAVTEMFKNTLVFVLNGIQPRSTLGGLFGSRGVLTRETKETSEDKKIAKKINIDLRNSLAHFMFRRVGKTMYYYDYKRDNNDWLLVRKEMDIGKLFEMSLRHNTLNKLLVEMIPEWYGL
jgi:hypothetical protein